MVAVGLGVDDVAEAATPLDLPFESHGVARLMRRVDQNEAVRSHHQAMIRALQSGLCEYVSR